MDEIYIVLIIWGILFVSAFIILPAVVVVKKKRLQAVKNYSRKYKALCELNKEILFSKQNEYSHNHYCKSKRDFEKTDLDDVAFQFIEKYLSGFKQALKDVENNQRLFKIYCLKYEQILEGDEKTQTLSNRGMKKFDRIEKRLLINGKMSPKINIFLVCKKSYASPRGRNYYSDRKIFDYEKIKHLFECAEKAIDIKDSEQYRRRQVRKEVTDSLRFDVFKRDSFRCRICGAGADCGVKLHVDHIKPVSKGGTSDSDNLQTLCQTCNAGKRDKFDDNVIEIESVERQPLNLADFFNLNND